MTGGKLVAGVLGGLIVAGAVVGVSYLKTATKEIEVHFFDKNKTNGKKIRFAVDTFSSSSLEIYKDNKWTKEIEEGEKTMYNRLFDIASKYLKIQNGLNLIKTSSKNFEKTTDNLCKDSTKCCCKPATGGNCDCKAGKCSTCLCCYLGDGKCCQQGQACNTDKFKKTQKTFVHLLKSPESLHKDIYLAPMQAYIKLTESSFDDLKNGNGKDEEKGFIGTMVYGFSDYSYKPIKYKNLIPDDKKSDYETLTEGKDYYFANIPQTFSFGKKDDSTNQSETNIEKIIKKLEDSSEVKALMEKDYSTATEDCCKDKNLDCLLKRNFMFMENTDSNTGLTNISNKIKDAEDCCK